MKTVIHFLLSVVIFFPMLVFIVTYMICKRRVSAVRAFGIASDQTTLWLFFSIPLTISGLWRVNSGMIFISIAIIIAMIVTYIDWRTKKEIEIKPLLRKIWRLYFLMLVTSYIGIWIIGIIHSVSQYIGLI